MRPIHALSIAAVVMTAIIAWAVPQNPRVDRDSPREEPARATREAADHFGVIARVLRHPRCLNCHPSGDRPHVADDAHLHAMNVQRGVDGHGLPGQRCSTCHQDANQDLAGLPGAPHWHLAPLSMGWEGLDDHDLAESLKDRAKNGDRSLEAILKHMAEDPLVGWAWEPGRGRQRPPISREDFVAAFQAWMDAGAVSPHPGKTSY